MSEETEQKESHIGCITVIIIIVAMLIIGGILFFTVWLPKLRAETSTNGAINTDGAGKLFSRSANNGDIELHVNDDFSLSINIIITPKTDIKNLQITFEFTDGSWNPITTRTHILGNVSTGVEYTVTYRLSEFSFSQMFKIEGVSANVTGGTVSYFA